MPAHSYAQLRPRPASSDPVLVLFVIVVGVIIGLIWLVNFGPSASSAATESPKVPVVAAVPRLPEVGDDDTFDYVFNMPRDHGSEQWDNYLVVNEFLERPENVGLQNLGFPAVHFSENGKEL